MGSLLVMSLAHGIVTRLNFSSPVSLQWWQIMLNNVNYRTFTLLLVFLQLQITPPCTEKLSLCLNDTDRLFAEHCFQLFPASRKWVA